jgi:hypothetical protein
VTAEDPLRRWATVALLAAVAVRTLVATGYEARFDVDPAMDPTPFAGFGPLASWLVDLVLLAASAAALWAERRAGRGIDPATAALALMPAIPVLFHGLSDAADLHRGSAWLSAAVAAAAAAHLSRDPASRRLLVVGLVAITVPLVAKGLWQALVDHPRTVAFFEENRTAFLAERGWDPEGPAAANFERRLRQVEATGWFGLANLVSALAAFATVALAGAAAAARGRVRWILVAAGFAAAALVLLNFSKGAVVATGFGLACLALGRGGNPTRISLVLVALVALAFLAAPLRGVFEQLAPGVLGERSLLFRSQYLEGGWRLLVSAIPLGIGPEGVQAAYLLAKSPRAPEDVTSLHSVFADWLVTLGPLGLAWAALAFRLVCAKSDEAAPALATALPPVPGRDAAAVALVLVLSLLGAAYAEPFLVDGPWLLVRVGGLLAAVGVAAAASAALGSAGPGRLRTIALAAAGVLLVLGQVEMVFFAVGPVAFAGVALGAAAAIPGRPLGERRPVAGFALVNAALVAIAAAIVVGGVLPQRNADALADEAAAAVAPLAGIRERWAEIRSAAPGSPVANALVDEVTALAGVEAGAAVRAAYATDGDAADRARRVGVTLQRLDAEQRARAADLLLLAAEAHPTSSAPTVAAIKQLAAAGRRTLSPRSTRIREPFLHAKAIEVARGHHLARPWDPRAIAMLADLEIELAAESANRPDAGPVDWRVALDAAQLASDRQPFAPSRILDVADLAAAAGDREVAADRYRAALAADAALELDPVVQWSPARVAEVNARLARVEAGEVPAGWPFVDGPRSPVSPRP